MRSIDTLHPCEQPVGEQPLPRFLRPPTPSVFTLEITTRCHHRCVGCGNVFAHRSQEMDVADWGNILERSRPFIQALRVTGGEPTLHRHFESMMKLIDGFGVPFVLFTNGNWLAVQSTLDILCGSTQLQGILVSLHGAGAASYRAFTKVDAFAAVTDNIRRAVEAGLRVATNTLLLTTTYQSMSEVADLALSLGISTVSFGRYYGRPLPGLSLSPAQLRAALVQIADLRQKEPRVVLSNCVPACFMPDMDLGERGCTSGFTHCTIGPRGEVRPCTHTPLTLGSIFEHDIAALWQSARLDGWRRRIPTPCLSCAALNRCRGGCRATAQQLALAADPLMGHPLAATCPESVVELAAQARPRLACAVEPTAYGYALSGTGRFVTLASASGPVLQALDGRSSLVEIRERFGEAGLQLVASLLQQRLVQLE